MAYFCRCDYCRKMMKKGKVFMAKYLGSYFKNYDGTYSFQMFHYDGYYYHPKFTKGRNRKDRKMKNKGYDYE